MKQNERQHATGHDKSLSDLIFRGHSRLSLLAPGSRRARIYPPHLFLDRPLPASISKNRKETVLPLTAELAQALAEVQPSNVAPFQRVFPTMPAMLAFRRDLSQASIAYIDESGRRVDFHSLRMTFGTNLTIGGAHPRVVMELMRHSDIKLTMKIYTDASTLPLRSALDSLPILTGTMKPQSVVTPSKIA